LEFCPGKLCPPQFLSLKEIQKISECSLKLVELKTKNEFFRGNYIPTPL
jgi:hypothetical protein